MKWITAARNVRYYEHQSRKHGIKPDRYYVIYFRRNGKQIGEKIGWASEGWTLEKVIKELNQLKANYRTGSGPTTLKEKRIFEQDRKVIQEIERQRKEKAEITFGNLFTKYYLPQQQLDGKKSWKEEERLFSNWISPEIGGLRLIDISPIHIERIKTNMAEKKLSARSIQYCLAVCRQAFNFAKKRDYFAGDNPIGKVKKPSIDNRRMRFLSYDEANRLLEEIKKHSIKTYRITLISLHCGLRFGEIAALTWEDINFEEETIMIRNPKNGQTRFAFFTGEVKTTLLQMEPKIANELIFPNAGKHERMKQITDVFMKSVNKLGLNKDVTDNRMKVVFHTCRHTFASRLVAVGTDLFRVKELMGHRSLAMTARYSHFDPDTLRKAIKTMELHINLKVPKDINEKNI